jgi:hypothetical protein
VAVFNNLIIENGALIKFLKVFNSKILLSMSSAVDLREKNKFVIRAGVSNANES